MSLHFFMQCVKMALGEKMRRVIRRYANRKMYDPQARRTITLSGIADLLREGLQVQVIDHTTGSDITSLTLSKVLLEQEKEKSTSAWGSIFLEELIRQRWGALLEVIEKSLSVSLEAIGSAEVRMREIVPDLVGSRKIDRREGQKILEKGLLRLAESKTAIQVQLERIVSRVKAAPEVFSCPRPSERIAVVRDRDRDPEAFPGLRSQKGNAATQT